MRICTFDLETSISDSPHGPQAKDPSNDFYTLIYGFHPDKIKVIHKEEGFKRNLGEHALAITTADLLVGHNMPFDLAYIIKQYYLQETPRIKKPYLPECWCLQVAEFLMSGQRHAYASLAELQEIYLGAKIKEDRISKLYKNNIGADRIIAARHRCKRLWRLYNQYCYDDGATVLKIFKLQYQRAKRLNMVPLIRMYNKFMVTLTIMMSEGIIVDLIHTEKVKQKFLLQALDLLSQAEKMVVPYWTDPRLPSFKLNSPAHRSAILFGGYIKNCEVVREVGLYKTGRVKTKKFKEDVYIEGFQLPTSLTREGKKEGQYSTDEEVINAIYEHTNNDNIKKYCGLQIKANRYKKMVSTYLDAFLKYSVNGVLYPQFNNTAVITSRLSSSSPNLQNIPSKGEFVKDIQGQLIAPEGFICAGPDWSQLEMWVAAWNSGDEQLIDDLLGGLDFHCQSLSFAEQIPYDEVYDLCHKKKDLMWCLKRSKAKAITFQKEYGAGANKIAQKTGLPVEIVRKVMDALDEKYWKLKLFKEHVFNTAKRNLKPSLIKHIPSAQRKGGENGRKFNGMGFELLPVLNGNNKYYDSSLIRHVGYYQTKHGKIYAFEEYADLDRNGNIRRSPAITQTKNYTSQGGAADVVAATSIELMQFALDNHDDVKYISQIHDANWLYVRESKKDLLLPQICDIMENVPYALKKHLNIDMNLRFPIEMKIGYNFAEMQVWGRQ